MLLKVLLKATVCVVAGLKEHGQISLTYCIAQQFRVV